MSFQEQRYSSQRDNYSNDDSPPVRKTKKDGDPGPMGDCRTCGRHFRVDVLERHSKVCAASQKKKRKVFDSGKMRATGTDIPISKTMRPGQPPPPPDPKLAKAMAMKNNWRIKHEQFINQVRAGREYSKAKETGGPLPPPPPPTINPDFVQCDYCGRRFSEKAAERHIPFCKEKNARVVHRPGVDPNAKNKQDIRTQYKPPAPKVVPKAGAGRGGGNMSYGDPRGDGGYGAPPRGGGAGGGGYGDPKAPPPGRSGIPARAPGPPQGGQRGRGTTNGYQRGGGGGYAPR